MHLSLSERERERARNSSLGKQTNKSIPCMGNNFTAAQTPGAVLRMQINGNTHAEKGKLLHNISGKLLLSTHARAAFCRAGSECTLYIYAAASQPERLKRVGTTVDIYTRRRPTCTMRALNGD